MCRMACFIPHWRFSRVFITIARISEACTWASHSMSNLQVTTQTHLHHIFLFSTQGNSIRTTEREYLWLWQPSSNVDEYHHIVLLLFLALFHFFRLHSPSFNGTSNMRAIRHIRIAYYIIFIMLYKAEDSKKANVPELTTVIILCYE